MFKPSLGPSVALLLLLSRALAIGHSVLTALPLSTRLLLYNGPAQFRILLAATLPTQGHFLVPQSQTVMHRRWRAMLLLLKPTHKQDVEVELKNWIVGEDGSIFAG
jgi:transposase InsO family protein